MIMTRDVSVSNLARERGLEHRLGELRAGLDDELAGLFVYADVAAPLARLHAEGMCVAVCSNLASAYGPSVRRLLPAVSDFVFSYEVGAVKPDPEIYQHVCDRLRVPASAVLFIGDSRRCDFDGPRAFGMQAALLDRLSGETIHSKLLAHLS